MSYFENVVGLTEYLLVGISRTRDSEGVRHSLELLGG
jgi:hypothetical protein